MFRFFQIFNFDPFLAGNGYDTENLNILKKIMNFHFRLRVLLFDPPTKFSLDVLKKQSYEIKLPPWTILGFKILEIFSVEN